MSSLRRILTLPLTVFVFVSLLGEAAQAQSFVWARAMGGASNDEATDVALDGSGNVYTVGKFQGTADFDPGAGTFNLTSAGSNDIFVSKLDSANQPLGVIDQQQLSVSPIGRPAIGGQSKQQLAQVVTAGLTGSLVAVWLPVDCSPFSLPPSDLHLEIQGVSAGSPNGLVLASQTIPGSDLPDFGLRRLAFSAPASFSAGEQFAIVLTSTGHCRTLLGSIGDPYLAGSAFSRASPSQTGQYGPWLNCCKFSFPPFAEHDDFVFRTEVFEELFFPPQPPTADAGPDQLVTVAPGESAMVTLDGSGSSDPNSDPLTFTWTNSFDGVVLLDQEQPLFDFTTVGAVGIGGNSEQKLAQVITAGISGPLAEVRMPIVLSAGNLRISVNNTIADSPGNTILASVVVAAGDLPGSFPTGVVFSSIVFDAPVFFSSGDQFSIVLECEGSPGSCQGAYVQGPVGNPYPGGNGWFDSRPNQPDVWVPIGGNRFDFPFQTFVLGSTAGPAMGEMPTVALGPGVHTITLTVDDGKGGMDSDTVEITVNQAPVADAGPDQVVTVVSGDTAMVTLDGSGSSDLDGDPLTFTWTNAFGAVMGATPTVTLGPGVHTMTLTVDDGKGGMDSDTVEITINQPPVANAGADQTLECTSFDGASMTLDGSGSFDPDLDPLTFTWTGPFPEGGGSVTGVGPTVTLPLGSHTISLTVEDDQGASDTDDVMGIVQDTTKPTLTLARNSTTISVPTKASEASVDVLTASGATASDVCDPSPVITTNAPAAFPLGVTLVTISARDASGNVTQKTFRVKVTTPRLEVSPKQLMFDLPEGSEPASQPFTVRAIDGRVRYFIHQTASFVHAEPDSGVSNGEVDQILAVVGHPGLPPGTYTKNLLFRENGVLTQKLAVTLIVRPVDPPPGPPPFAPPEYAWSTQPASSPPVNPDMRSPASRSLRSSVRTSPMRQR